ncbi:MAG: hypothetical protein K6C99_09265 [Lachnospiraceae bacterium]|nr:hypothetical protein [Lachnospiraceae bacterium]
MSGKVRTVSYVRSTNANLYFLFVGFALLAMGVIVNHSDSVNTGTGKEVSPAYGLIFALLGLWMLSMGIIALFIEPARKRAMIDELKKKNDTVVATIVGFPRNPGNRVDRMAPYLLECRYRDDVTGLVYIYYGNAFRMPDNRLLGCRVTVYTDKTDPSRYYVDMSRIENPAMTQGTYMGGVAR